MLAGTRNAAIPTEKRVSINEYSGARNSRRLVVGFRSRSGTVGKDPHERISAKFSETAEAEMVRESIAVRYISAAHGSFYGDSAGTKDNPDGTCTL